MVPYASFHISSSDHPFCLHSSFIRLMLTEGPKDQAFHNSADVLSGRKEKSGNFSPVCQFA